VGYLYKRLSRVYVDKDWEGGGRGVLHVSTPAKENVLSEKVDT